MTQRGLVHRRSLVVLVLFNFYLLNFHSGVDWFDPLAYFFCINGGQFRTEKDYDRGIVNPDQDYDQ